LQGTSLRPLLEDPNTDWDHPACTVRRSNWNGRPITGRTIRTEHWRYTEWDGGHEGRELYDHTADPGEQRNLAEDHQYESVVRELSKRLAEEVTPQTTESSKFNGTPRATAFRRRTVAL
jgi:uncharacterized sulfatase